MNFSSQSCAQNGKVKNDNNLIIISNNNPEGNKDPKGKYVKIVVKDPYSNRDIILKVSKQQKGVFSPSSSNLNPYWVTGFCDAEACFGFRVRKNPKLKIGWEVLPYFSINLHVKDLSILSDIKEFFGVGNIAVIKKQLYTKLVLIRI